MFDFHGIVDYSHNYSDIIVDYCDMYVDYSIVVCCCYYNFDY